MAALIGKCTRTVRRIIDALERVGVALVTRERGWMGARGSSPKEYRVMRSAVGRA